MGEDKSSQADEEENTEDSDIELVDDEGRPLQPKPRPNQTSKAVNEIYSIFKEILGRAPLNWRMNKSQRIAAANLHKERGVKQVRNALVYYREHQHDEHMVQITSPYDLDAKWAKLNDYKRKHG